MSRVHRVTDKSVVTRSFRILDYREIAAILRTGDTAFFENTKELPLKRQTMWKAAKRLSVMVGKKVSATRGAIKLNGDAGAMDGYLFQVEA